LSTTAATTSTSLQQNYSMHPFFNVQLAYYLVRTPGGLRIIQRKGFYLPSFQKLNQSGELLIWPLVKIHSLTHHLFIQNGLLMTVKRDL
jgi:hypothetical protein